MFNKEAMILAMIFKLVECDHEIKRSWGPCGGRQEFGGLKLIAPGSFSPNSLITLILISELSYLAVPARDLLV